MKEQYEQEGSRQLVATGSSKPLVKSKISLNKIKITRNNRMNIEPKESNSMFIEQSILPLKKEKLQQKFRKLSKEKLQKGLSKINLSKDDIKIKLRRDNSENLPLENSQKIDINVKSKDATNTSIFNITFG